MFQGFGKRLAVCLWLFAGLLVGCATRELPVDPVMWAERKGVEFLTRDVPAWRKENGCFSCHNNGDAARALYIASTRGYRIPKAALAETTDWLQRPQTWDDNQGDPGFSDQRLADVQFAAALLTAIDRGHAKNPKAVKEAVKRVLNGQTDDGSWPIDAPGTLGSPATYGAPLATFIARQILDCGETQEAANGRIKAEAWLHSSVPVNSTLNAAILVMALTDSKDPVAQEKRAQSLQLLQRTQTSDGGWGPYPHSPPEIFDTAMALLSFAAMREEADIRPLIERGRKFLAANQYDDGSWPATTRPSGGNSYAQQLSTTGWAVIALLETRD